MKTNDAGVALIKQSAARFWCKVAIKGVEDCWVWQSRATANGGYGAISFGRGYKERAHRVAWMLTNGPIPEGKCILHACDNPPCCNPKHLFIGTKLDNTHDAMKKGRLKPPPIHRGENHPLRRMPWLVKRGQANGNSRTMRALRDAN